MGEIHIDWLEGENTVITRDGREQEATRAAIVTSIEANRPGPPIDPDPFSPIQTPRSGGGLGFYSEALAALPEFGDTHPEYGDLIVVGRDVSPIDPGHARATINYLSKDNTPTTEGSRIRITGAVDVVTGLVNDLNRPEEDAVVLDYRADGPVTPEGDQPIPIIVAEFTRRVVQRNVLTEVETYIGKLNSTSWLGAFIDSWLCTNIDAEVITYNIAGSSKEQHLWELTYRFEKRADLQLPEPFPSVVAGWNFNLTYPGDNIEIGPTDLLSVRSARIYEEADFKNGLNLGWE